MGTTPNFAFRYPALTDAPNGPLQMQNLATDVDTALLTEQTARVALSSYGSGIIARNRRTTNGTGTTASTSATAQKLMELDAPMKAGHLYRVAVLNVGLFTNTANAEANVQITYTVDGSTPAVNSAVLCNTQTNTLTGSLVEGTSVNGLYVAQANVTFKGLVSYYLAASGTTLASYGNANWPVDMVIEDLGVDVGSTGTNF